MILYIFTSLKMTLAVVDVSVYCETEEQMGGGSSKLACSSGNAALVMLTKHSLTHLSHIWHILVANIASAAAGRRAETHNSAIIPGKIAR